MNTKNAKVAARVVARVEVVVEVAKVVVVAIVPKANLEATHVVVPKAEAEAEATVATVDPLVLPMNTVVLNSMTFTIT